MEVLLDTNFIVSCILKKIDFLGELEEMGFKVILPKEVFQELKDLKKDKKTSHKEREAIELAFQLFDVNNIKKMNVGGRYADEGLIAKGLEGYYIASLDNGIKREVPNRIVILNSRKSLGVERS